MTGPWRFRGEEFSALHYDMAERRVAATGQAPSHPQSSLECVRAIIQRWPGNRRLNPPRRCQLRLIDGEPSMVSWVAVGHPVWAECSHVLIVDPC